MDYTIAITVAIILLCIWLTLGDPILVGILTIPLILFVDLCVYNGGGVWGGVDPKLRNTKYPFIPIEPGTKEFIEFVKDPNAISNLHEFLQTNIDRCLREFIRSPNIIVADDIFSDSAYNFLTKALKNIINSGKDDVPEYKIKLQNAEIKQNLALGNLKNVYNKTNGKVLQSIAVLAGEKKYGDEGLHATSILIDFDNKKMIYIDPHFVRISTSSYDGFLEVRKHIIEINPAMSDFWYGNINDLINLDNSCPIFQGSLQEKLGLCPMWSTYLLALFAINDIADYERIVGFHKRNVDWTKLNLQQFMYTIYKKYKKEIDSIKRHNKLIHELDIKTSTSAIKGEFDCTKNGMFWGPKLAQCFADESHMKSSECENESGNVWFENNCWKRKELKDFFQRSIDEIVNKYEPNSSKLSAELEDFYRYKVRTVMLKEEAEELLNWHNEAKFDFT